MFSLIFYSINALPTQNTPQETLKSRCAPCVFTVKTAAARQMYCVFPIDNGGARVQKSINFIEVKSCFLILMLSGPFLDRRHGVFGQQSPGVQARAYFSSKKCVVVGWRPGTAIDSV